ncbi:MAG: sigma-54 dependent transcriptional regulator [Pseudomonadota bacterium]
MSILIADDDTSIIVALKLLLNSEGMASEACQTPDALLARIAEKNFKLALIDMNYCKDTTSGNEGLELISKIRKLDENIPIVVMTGWATIPLVVDAMQRGASDFIEKPWDNNRLLNIIHSQMRISEIGQRATRLSAENSLLQEQARQKIITSAPAMLKLLESAKRIAESDISVLITGENGTGKSLLASYVHENSKRRDASLITVNMGGISETTFESEMFGHVKGAFTDARTDRIGRVELAKDGSLFLDEIANMPMNQQAKILRLLEERQFEKLGASRSQPANVRFISATNADLGMLVRDKGFREDLLFRLNGVTLHVPALRERTEDIPLLANVFLEQARHHSSSVATHFSPETMALLQKYAWPGNIRELHHVIERAVLLALEEEIQPADLQLPSVHQADFSGDEDSDRAEQLATLSDMTLDEAESHLIMQALIMNNHDVEKTAEKLGLSRSALYRRLQKYGISL